MILQSSLRKIAGISKQAANCNGSASLKNVFHISLSTTGLNQLSQLKRLFSEKISGHLFPITT